MTVTATTAVTTKVTWGTPTISTEEKMAASEIVTTIRETIGIAEEAALITTDKITVTDSTTTATTSEEVMVETWIGTAIETMSSATTCARVMAAPADTDLQTMTTEDQEMNTPITLAPEMVM